VSATASGTFDSQDAGSRSATATYSLVDGSNGGLAANYSLADTTGHSATIAKATLTVSGTTAAGKTYDGNTTAAITVGTLSGLVGSETVSATASGTFDSKDAGSRSATATYSLVDGNNGGLAANYSLANTTGHSATIEKAAVEYPNEADDNKYSTGWVRFQNQESAPLPWPQMIKVAVPAVEIRSPGIRLPETAFQIDLPALAAANSP
jgi:hypothetical protein